MLTGHHCRCCFPHGQAVTLLSRSRRPRGVGWTTAAWIKRNYVHTNLRARFYIVLACQESKSPVIAKQSSLRNTRKRICIRLGRANHMRHLERLKTRSSGRRYGVKEHYSPEQKNDLVFNSLKKDIAISVIFQIIVPPLVPDLGKQGEESS